MPSGPQRRWPDGPVAGGPAGSPLPPVEVSVEGGAVTLV
ncbi:hypothetical protein HDA32_000990 [Spinactinospora alkalitolerans]|uniref:Uncharacterized protein n=1 Tax=Spinactinospora alkalitolerans TaxID=687207 RepID=A0A852TVE4_9ACTN|nr:hypothetical protein [Spinactinospora alkalitolerans]